VNNKGRGANFSSAPDFQPVWQPRHSFTAVHHVSQAAVAGGAISEADS
jgi:hypothetical protein